MIYDVLSVGTKSGGWFTIEASSQAQAKELVQHYTDTHDIRGHKIETIKRHLKADPMNPLIVDNEIKKDEEDASDESNIQE